MIKMQSESEHESSMEIGEKGDENQQQQSNMDSATNKLLKSIMLEHCYSRPYNWRPESNFLRPTKTLFMSQTMHRRKSVNPLVVNQDIEDMIDVESVPAPAAVIYDADKSQKLMEECEKFAAGPCNKREDSDDVDWEEKITRNNWTHGQNHLFNVMVNILNSDRMSRLAFTGVHNEPILRRTVIEKSVKRYRQLMAKYSWDTKLIQWLHQLLMDNLSASYLASYLDILQTLRGKLPTFVDRILFSSTSNLPQNRNSESLFGLLKRPWDPVAGSLNQDKPKKLPGNVVIIIVPGSPAYNQSKRLNRWMQSFASLTTVCTVQNNIGGNAHKLTMMNCVDQMFAATRAKIQEVKAEYPNRAIVLCGFNAGAAIALQVAQVETVLCIVCLGFSIHTAEGNRGDPDDNLLELQVPVLFVIGQNANTTLQEYMEDIRERMRVETGLLVVGSADDYLRITKKKKRCEGITQNIVDRCIVDEVGEFISGLLLSPYPPQIRQSPAHIPATIDAALKRPKIEQQRKRNNSNASSLDSEPPSPTPRISRPGQSQSPVLGRPPGSKSKSKIEAKWHAMQQGIPPPIPANNTTTTNSTQTHESSSNSSASSITSTSTILPRSDRDPIETIKKALAAKTTIAITNTSSTHHKTNIHTPSLITTTPAAAKLQAMGLQQVSGRGVYQSSSTLSNLLQGGGGGGVRTLPPNPQATKQIKVLDNLAASGVAGNKILNVAGRLDMSKISVISPSASQATTKLAAATATANSYGNVMVMPDGKIKQQHASTIRGIGPNTVIYTNTKGSRNKYNTTQITSSSNTTSSVAKSSLTKYITSKKQLLANRNKLIKKLPPHYHHHQPGNLPPPPANLTSQEIMDLPIIFADDNQILTNASKAAAAASTGGQPQKLLFLNAAGAAAAAANKQSTAVLKQNILKRPSPSPSKGAGNPIKYAKIILSKAPTASTNSSSTSSTSSSSSSSSDEVKKLVSTRLSLPVGVGDVDVENDLVATTISKPAFLFGDFRGNKQYLSVGEQSRKIDEDEESDDPEYIPNKSDL